MNKNVDVRIIGTSNRSVKVGDKFKVNISAKKGGCKRESEDGTGGRKRCPRKPKQPSLREIVLQFIEQQERFNKKIENVIKLNNLKS
jgi:hypothetical protein